MLYDLNENEEKVKIGGKTYFLGDIKLDERNKLLSDNAALVTTTQLRKFWIIIIHNTLRKSNSEYEECDNSLIENEEIINFINKIRG